MRFTGRHSFTGNVHINDSTSNFLSVKYKLNIPLSKSPNEKYGDIFITNDQFNFINRFDAIKSLLPINNIEIAKNFIFASLLFDDKFSSAYKNINVNYDNLNYYNLDYTSYDNVISIIFSDVADANNFYLNLEKQINNIENAIINATFNDATSINLAITSIYLFDNTTVNLEYIIQNISDVFDSTGKLSLETLQINIESDKDYELYTTRHKHDDEDLLLNKNTPNGYLYIDNLANTSLNEQNLNVNNFNINNNNFSTDISNYKYLNFKSDYNISNVNINQIDNTTEFILDYVSFDLNIYNKKRFGNLINISNISLTDFTIKSDTYIDVFLIFDLSDSTVYTDYTIANTLNNYNLYEIDFINKKVKIYLYSLKIYMSNYVSQTPQLEELKIDFISKYLENNIQKRINIPIFTILNKYSSIKYENEDKMIISSDSTIANILNIYEYDLILNTENTYTNAVNLDDFNIYVKDVNKYKISNTSNNLFNICILEL